MNPPEAPHNIEPSADHQNSNQGKRSKVGTIWVTLAIFVVILVLLLVFIIQNSTSVQIKYFGASGHIGFGVAMLVAAVAGSALTLLIGSVRILQLKLSRKSAAHDS